MIEKKERNYSFDNIKGIMIILMIFGHVIEEFGLSGSKELIWTIIYSFHMPVFVFVSGFFSKKSTCADNAVQNLLIPYLIFDLVYVLLFDNSFRFFNLLLPRYAYWYLFALFIWRILINNISKVRFIGIISVLAGLVVGIFNEYGDFLAISRIICFLPFFIFGYKLSETDYNKIKEKKYLISLGLVGTVITVILNVKNIMPHMMYVLAVPYSDFGIPFVKSILLRAIIYAVAFMFIIAFIVAVPNKKNVISTIGERTITIYLFSSLLIKGFFTFLPDYLLSSISIWVQILLSAGLTVVIVALTGNKFILKAYNRMIGFVSSVVIHKD